VALEAISPMAEAQSGNPEAEWYKDQLDRARIRFAKMVTVLESTLPEDFRKKIFENVGRECANQYSDLTWKKYHDNIKGFLDSIQTKDGWVESVVFDETKGVITITDKQHKCTCPLVKQGTTPASQCDCTLGWQKETYSQILGRPVQAAVLKSILRGDDRCVFQITIMS
jgi:predicted hydrocarbon binding protein